jgi:hypothetical protein
LTSRVDIPSLHRTHLSLLASRMPTAAGEDPEMAVEDELTPVAEMETVKGFFWSSLLATKLQNRLPTS